MWGRMFIMFCKNCGNEIKDGVKFCGKCGEKIEREKTQETNEQQDTVNVSKKVISEKSKKSDDDKKWSEMTTYEKIETVYGTIFLIILLILAIRYHSEIAFAWRIADSKITFIIHLIDCLYILSIWNIPLCIIEVIYFAIKKKMRRAIYAFLSILGCVIVSLIASAILGDVGAEIVFFIALLIIGCLIKIFKERVVDKNVL